MAIPESQLITWSSQGSITQSSNTYNSIKGALEASGVPYAGKNYEVFLQGSYGNDTNIYAESDVDIVIRLDNCWQSDLDDIPQNQKDAYNRAFVAATYTHLEFKRDVTKVLSEKYGSDVKPGSKAIAIAANGTRRKADVIAAIEFRRYRKFNSTLDQDYEPGIAFWTTAGQRIANYPKQHSRNLTTKHKSTNQWLKPMVRIFKNLRSKLVEDGLLQPGVAPSYYLEGLLYNVPSPKFGSTYQDSFVNAMNWIQSEADKDELVCANEQYYLLRDGFPTCWPKADGKAFLIAASKMWKEW